MIKLFCLVISIIIAAVVGFWLPSVFGPDLGILLSLPVGLTCGFVGCVIGDELEYRARNRY